RRMLELAGDDDGRLRFQVALSLGAAPGEDAIAALARIALAGANDVWTRRAVATAAPEQAGELLTAVLAAGATKGGAELGRLALCGELAQLVGARKKPEEVAVVVRALAVLRRQGEPERVRGSVVLGLAKGLRSRGASLDGMLTDRSAAEAVGRILLRAA